MNGRLNACSLPNLSQRSFSQRTQNIAPDYEHGNDRLCGCLELRLFRQVTIVTAKQKYLF